MIDTLRANEDDALALEAWREFGLEPGRYVLVTLHRPSNVDDPHTLAALLATLDPGDEVLVPEPAHDNYRPACYLADAEPVAVLLGPDGRLDPDRLEAAWAAASGAA